VYKASQELAPLLEIYEKNTTMDIESYYEAELEDFKFALDDFAEQKIKFRKMKDNIDVGIF
jgi:hypothetical protein